MYITFPWYFHSDSTETIHHILYILTYTSSEKQAYGMHTVYDSGPGRHEIAAQQCLLL